MIVLTPRGVAESESRDEIRSWLKAHGIDTFACDRVEISGKSMVVHEKERNDQGDFVVKDQEFVHLPPRTIKIKGALPDFFREMEGAA